MTVDAKEGCGPEQPLLPWELRLERFELLASTQDEARRRVVAREDAHGLVVRALEQSRGRGRKRREWASARGGSYQTLVIRDERRCLLSTRVPIAVALGIAETFARRGLRIGLKWPNDLWLEGRKLGGILCERLRDHLLVGVGINVANEVPATAAALLGWSCDEVSDMVLQGIREGLDAWLESPRLRLRFAAYDVLAGRYVTASRGPALYEGVVLGIDDRGCLQLRRGEEAISLCDAQIEALGPPRG